jgi:carboxymethylenebutenolidase
MQAAMERLCCIFARHGRSGPYSSAAHGVYDASSLSKRNLMWGQFWAEKGYTALLVDSFGPRGYPQGFSIHSHSSRPADIDETVVRPFHAYAALNFLKKRANGNQVLLQGWSNGASATLVALSKAMLSDVGLKPDQGFAGGVAYYPGCGSHRMFAGGYRPYAPVRVFSAGNDEEVSAASCLALISRSFPRQRATIDIYAAATHDFDDPGWRRQRVNANVRATVDSMAKVASFAAGLQQIPTRSARNSKSPIKDSDHN